MFGPLTFAIVLIALVTAIIARIVRARCLDRIAMGHFARRREPFPEARHLFVFLTDHYEPLWKGASHQQGIERVRHWCENYPRLVDDIRDRGGRTPQHAYFYPEEEYLPECMELLADQVKRGFGDVEVHLHHRNDTAANLRETLTNYTRRLRDQHGLLRDDGNGKPTYGFIHGNWVLANSHPEGDHCGVDNEVDVLLQTGCYADFTFPSAPDRSQPPVTNRIYYASGNPKTKTHWEGIDARFKQPGPDDRLLLVNGTVGINWQQRRRGVLPAVENSDINYGNPVTRDRVDMWVRTGVHVAGFPRWSFIKAHTHGLQDKNAALLLSQKGLDFYRYLLDAYNDGDRYTVHFVTPWEARCLIKALERGDSDAIDRAENHFQYTT